MYLFCSLPSFPEKTLMRYDPVRLYFCTGKFGLVNYRELIMLQGMQRNCSGNQVEAGQILCQITLIHYGGNHTFLNFKITHIVQLNDGLKRRNSFNFSHPILHFFFRIEGTNLQAGKKVNQCIIKTNKARHKVET